MGILRKTLFISLLILHQNRLSNAYQQYREQKYDAEVRDLKSDVKGNRVQDRILLMMRGYYIEADKKIEDMNDIRFIYEETGYYESGYLMGEIIERYRKIVSITKRQMAGMHASVFKNLKELQSIQMLYFELYHLVMMMHEIPNKYKKIGLQQFADKMPESGEIQLSQADVEAYKKLQIIEEAKKRLEEKRAKKLALLHKQLKEFYERGAQIEGWQSHQRTKAKWWHYDYGWDIGDEW